MLDRLAGLGLIDRTGNTLGGISFDATDFTGQTMTNIVNSLAARGQLINKAIGIPNAFHMNAELVKELKTIKPTAMTEFMAILHGYGGQSAIKGLALGNGWIAFPGFPDTAACRILAERIVHAAVTNRWIKGKAPAVTNEKYSFRVWLNSLGMTGEAYAGARAELLKNLSGDSAFRTEEQRAAFYSARRRRPAQEPDFILL
ncbi:MAG: hypothetical protein IKE58_10215 [Blautia sp.]|nr:hypothetical protein [Blautia sp.]